MTMWLLGVLACTPQMDPDALAAQLLSADADAAIAALAASPELAGPLGAWQPLAVRLVGLSAERDAIRAAERGMLLDAAREALDGPHPAAAAASLEAGLRTHPGDPELVALLERFRAAAASAAPEDAARMYTALAELEPDAAEQHRGAAEAADLASRYHPDQVAETRSAQAGARLEAAVHLLGQLEREYHLPPDWETVTAAGQRRLTVLASDPGAREAVAGLAAVRWPVVSADGLAGAVGALTAAASAAEAAGVPAEVVVVEWVDAALGALDPWTRAVWPAEIAAWRAHHDGISYGVGLELTETEAGSVFVNRPQLDTPAWDSDLKQGDRIDRIWDEAGAVTLSEVPVGSREDAAAAALVGEAGTAVRLAVTRPDVGPLEVSLTRGPVKMPTLHGYQRAEDNAWRLWLDEAEGLAYARVLSFREYTEPDFDALLAPVAGQARGLLLDLRSNPGGDLNASVQIADRFVTDGLLAELSGRLPKDDTPPVDPETGEPLVPWNHAIEGHAQEGLSVVVLVDRDTASAAEILAGVLQERAGAVVVGAPTWGKGYTQVLRSELELGYAVQFTNQIWTLPSGRHLARSREGGGGIQPDVPLVLSPGEQFQADLLARQRAALRVHRDGTPLEWMDTVRRSDMPPLSADPALLYGELILRALLYRDRGAL